MNKRICLVFSLVLAFILLFTSCKGTDQPTVTPTESGTDRLYLAKDGVCSYTVVRPDLCSKAVTSAAVLLRKAMTAVIGSEPAIITDYDPETEYEIVIGDTRRAESAAAAEKLDGKDYIIQVIGKKLVIYGKDDSATASAVRYVATEMFGYQSASDFTENPNLSVPQDLFRLEVIDMTIRDPRNANDTIIATVSVLDYGAVADGETDCTKAFQNAIDAVRKLGGGTVYAPAGSYLIKGSLKVTRSVYLIGEWYNPETEPEKIKQGTVLLATGNAGKGDGTPLITVGASAGVLGLTVLYPDQSPTEPIAYPATILLKDSVEGDGTQHASSVQCVTILGAWRGIAADQGLQLPTMRDIYITALDYGFKINGCYDCARIITMHVSPRYWATYDAAVKEETLRKTMQEKTVAYCIMRTDGQMMTDIVAEYCNVGILLRRNPNDSGETAGYTSVSNLRILHCQVGIDNEYNTIEVAGGTFETEDACLINRSTATATGTVSLYDCTFTTEGDACIYTEEDCSCLLSVQNCTFAAWNGNYAVESEGSMLIMTNNDFRGKNGGVLLENTTQAACVTNNRFADGCKSTVVNRMDSDRALVETQSQKDIPEAVKTVVTVPAVPALGKTETFNVQSYGAKGDGKTDDTDAFTNAIAAAKKAGGGIVYVPAGYYRITETLVLPTGVELRGIHESGHVLTGEGSVIYVIPGKGEEDADAFLTMESGSILRGVTFFYPEQAWNNVKTYPVTVQVKGKNCVIRNVCFGNAYRAIDMETYDCGGHYVENVFGTVFAGGIAVANSTEPGYLISTHFNPSFYYACWGTKLSDASGDFTGSGMAKAMFSYVNEHLTAYRFGATEDETLLFVFNYRARYGLDFTGGFNGTTVGCAVDGSLCGIRVTGEYENPLVLVNVSNDVVPGKTPEGNLGVYVSVSENSVVRMVESGASSYNYVPSELVVLKQGNLVLEGFIANVSPTTNGALWIKGGKATVSGITFKHVGPLDSKGAFTVQTKENALDVRVDAGAALELSGALARNFYRETVIGEVDPDLVLVTK